MIVDSREETAKGKTTQTLTNTHQHLRHPSSSTPITYTLKNDRDTQTERERARWYLIIKHIHINTLLSCHLSRMASIYG